MMKMNHLLWILSMSLLGVGTLPQYKDVRYALVKSPKFCIPPYELIGQQCLFFSRPYEPWGITHSWDKAYKNFYDASIFCMERGGFLAEQIKDVQKAQRFCKYLKGSCTPSLIARHGSCYQWSPVDGQETRVPCNTEGLKARFVCQQNE
eukprot:TRINITY_DN12143_c0_g1_i1.p1 TRINITY_DN12143_c0_g1~~TRINITY_DN12143_c0_g1_i1.p1  ORF type:complete len:149 (+),score=27.60 TRINITY_DN12143_c0_g1_i1:189-635(+)